jgi:hypothetical protein
VLTASLDGTARLWDATKGKSLGEPMKHSKSYISKNSQIHFKGSMRVHLNDFGYFKSFEINYLY